MKDIDLTIPEECPKCDSWRVRQVSVENKLVANEYTSNLEPRIVLRFQCRDCAHEWNDYE